MWLCKGSFLIFLTVLIKSNGNYQGNHKHSNETINSKRELQIERNKLELGGILLFKTVENNINDKEIVDSEMNSRTEDNGFTIPNNRNIVIVVLDDNIKTLTREGLTILLPAETESMANNFNPYVLRNAYTDACIKVAIRKCYQALYNVYKNVCKARYRCKSKFKSYFKQKSKEGCIKEFDYRQERVHNKMASKFRNNKVHNTKFIDATRQGYVDACIPYMVPQYKEGQIRNAVQNNKSDIMLRSRSEKRCRIIIREKCIKACYFAVNASCNFYACSRRRWRVFDKACKEECRRIYPAYRNNKKSDSSSASDSE